jgi:hypothetical protein
VASLLCSPGIHREPDEHQTTLIKLSSNIVTVPKHLEKTQLTANIVAVFPRAPWRYPDFGWQRKWCDSTAFIPAASPST